MGLFDKLLGRDAPGEITPAQSVVVALDRPFVNQSALDAAKLRIGMWVKTADGIGILTGYGDVVIKPSVYSDPDANGETELIEPAVSAVRATVTLAKPDGATKMTLNGDDKAVPHVLVLEPADVTQAPIEDIPESRRLHLDEMISLGYQRGDA